MVINQCVLQQVVTHVESVVQAAHANWRSKGGFLVRRQLVILRCRISRRRAGELARPTRHTRDPESPSPEQSVEAPVVGLYRENLHLAEASLKGVLTKHRGTHDSSGGRGLRVSHGAGEAGDHAPAVLSSFPR